MSMARTIMQEEAPPNQRSRVMSFYSFAFMGSGPIGAFANGYLVQWIGPRAALALASAVMFTVIALITAKSRLWQLDPTTHHSIQARNAATASSE